MKPAALLILLFLSCPACLMADNAALAARAREQVGVTVSYNGGYQSIPYPNGDVPLETGVCTDVVIRAMRAFGLDLQKAVHEDMKAHFSKYPKIWGLKTTDRSIDHRRVPNLRTFFARKGWSVPITENAADYEPGDLVTWNLSDSIPHIGIVSDRKTEEGTPLIIHNVGAGTQEEDFLFSHTITGHYRPVLAERKQNFRRFSRSCMDIRGMSRDRKKAALSLSLIHPVRNAHEPSCQKRGLPSSCAHGYTCILRLYQQAGRR